MQDLENDKNKKVPLWGKSLVGFGIIGVLVVIALPSFLNTSHKADAYNARSSVTVALNIQRENYEETNRFVQSWDELGVSYPSNGENYEFKISLIDGNALVTASPKKDGLPSFTGLVFVSRGVGTYGLSGGICATLKPSRTPPIIDTTSYPSNSVTGGTWCPVGSQSLE